MEVDYEGDFWADHDEDCHGEIDTEEMREEFPEGFFWTCCRRAGDEPGCKLGVHQRVPELFFKKVKHDSGTKTAEPNEIEEVEEEEYEDEEEEDEDEDEG
jgi:hypothetical protein